ncbi:MAG: cyclic nucleotide-binding domain-containing protein [bacterium]|nr:cyclic nucleotide-binding domain-containing protein [bacterium]
MDCERGKIMLATNTIQEIQCFPGLSDTQLEKLCAIAEEKNYPKGEFIQREKGEADALYVVKQGRVTIEMTLPGNHTISIYTVHPGDLFGWSALVPPHVVTASSHCEEDTVALALPREKMIELFKQDVGVKAEVFEFISRAVGKRLKEARDQMSFLLG